MNKHTPVLDFSYDTHTEQFVGITNIHDLSYAPFMLTAREEQLSPPELAAALNLWWDRRVVSASRPFLRQTLGFFYPGTEALGENKRELELKIRHLARVNLGLSLSDQYWITDSKNPNVWGEINYFRNSFSNDVGKAFFANTESSPPSYGTEESNPNSTLIGMMQKAWRCSGEKRLLYKASVNEQQLVNEIIATGLYKRLLSPEEYVAYSIEVEDKMMYSVCENMLDVNHELIPALHVTYHYSFADRVKQYEGYAPYLAACKDMNILNPEKSLSKMIVCDYILANTDRHWTNFGVIRNVDTLEVERLAPLFDNGNSLYFNSLSQFGKGERVSYETAHSFRKLACEQLQLAKDMNWFNADALDGFPEKVRNLLLPIYDWSAEVGVSFVTHIINDMSKRIEDVVEHQKNL